MKELSKIQVELNKEAIIDYIDSSTCFSVYDDSKDKESFNVTHDWISDNGQMNVYEGKVIIRSASAYGTGGEQGKHLLVTELKEVRNLLEDQCIDGDNTNYIYI